jgi:hypothetical protein
MFGDVLTGRPLAKVFVARQIRKAASSSRHWRNETKRVAKSRVGTDLMQQIHDGRAQYLPSAYAGAAAGVRPQLPAPQEFSMGIDCSAPELSIEG